MEMTSNQADSVLSAAEITTDTIVVGVDGSEQSVAALRFATHLADRLGARVHAITAWSEPQVFTPYRALGANADQYAEETLTATIRSAFPDQPPASFTSEIRHGHPAYTLITASKSARMLVIGCRGRGGLPGALLGSVSSACAAHAHCSVIIHHWQKENPTSV